MSCLDAMEYYTAMKVDESQLHYQNRTVWYNNNNNNQAAISVYLSFNNEAPETKYILRTYIMFMETGQSDVKMLIYPVAGKSAL